MMMDISTRTQQIGRVFSFDRRVELEDTRLDIVPFRFVQANYGNEIKELQKKLSATAFCPVTDDRITENEQFDYAVFMPDRGRGNRMDKAIVMLHGLNEHSWNKYLAWAEYLAGQTGRAVILFPIAFHMNRSPCTWNNPRLVLPWVDIRRKSVSGLTDSTFANVALSYRLSGQPLRFHVSGLQSAYNVRQLAGEIRSGRHPLFKEGASVNIFAYSIGAFLSQVLLLADTGGLFAGTKLFMFCGGSILSRMNGNARDILDREASDRLMSYYINDFRKEHPIPFPAGRTSLEEAFRMMIVPDEMRSRRESFFQSAARRIRAISLKKDTVIPTGGVEEALGESALKILKEWDFPFDYTHQIPFPHHPKEGGEPGF
ncbi:MAG: DUF6051 family protein [Mediterranea sp.]|jgi:hypothetical protein|nr:DUF6051 family protein [Mediterranea sp.]